MEQDRGVFESRLDLFKGKDTHIIKVSRYLNLYLVISHCYQEHIESRGYCSICSENIRHPQTCIIPLKCCLLLFDKNKILVILGIRCYGEIVFCCARWDMELIVKVR